MKDKKITCSKQEFVNNVMTFNAENHNLFFQDDIDAFKPKVDESKSFDWNFIKFQVWQGIHI